jgi:hypothetical protein
VVNPLSASCSCDARIGGCRQNGLLVPRSPFSRHPPIERHSLPQRTSHYCISPMISKFKLTLSLLNSVKIHYKIVSQITHGTKRVNMIKDFKILLVSKGLNTIPYLPLLATWLTNYYFFCVEPIKLNMTKFMFSIYFSPHDQACH